MNNVMKDKVELVDWHKYFHVDLKTGVLKWKYHRNPSTHSQLVGTIAGYMRKDGYLDVMIFGRKYLLHRIIFFLANGHLPKVIDHINGITSDNRPSNLREATKSENCQNAKLSAANKSGVKGVCWHKATRKWRAQVMIDGKRKHLGQFACVKQAELVAKNERMKSHKEFANHGE